jgi:hypothetical protein
VLKSFFDSNMRATEQIDAIETLSVDSFKLLVVTRVIACTLMLPYDKPLIVEGYASSGSPSEELVQSRRRAAVVRNYLQLHFHLQPKDTGIIALSSTPPESTGKTTFDGVSLVSVGRDSK